MLQQALWPQDLLGCASRFCWNTEILVTLSCRRSDLSTTTTNHHKNNSCQNDGHDMTGYNTGKSWDIMEYYYYTCYNIAIYNVDRVSTCINRRIKTPAAVCPTWRCSAATWQGHAVPAPGHCTHTTTVLCPNILVKLVKKIMFFND